MTMFECIIKFMLFSLQSNDDRHIRVPDILHIELELR